MLFKEDPFNQTPHLLGQAENHENVLTAKKTGEVQDNIFLEILEGLVPNCGLEALHNERRGREIKIPPLKGKSSVRTLREQSFQVNGPKLFNSIPKKVRECQWGNSKNNLTNS